MPTYSIAWICLDVFLWGGCGWVWCVWVWVKQVSICFNNLYMVSLHMASFGKAFILDFCIKQQNYIIYGYNVQVYVFNAYLDFFQQLFLNAALQFQVTVSLQKGTGRTRSHACAQVLGTSTCPITLPNWQPFQRHHDGCQEQPPHEAP